MFNFFLFDKLIPFTRKKNNLNILNLYQVYKIRYGIGKNISKRINKYSSVQNTINILKYKENDINTNIKNIFIDSENKLDEFLEINMRITIKHNYDLYNYKGLMYKYRLPMNGQSKRSNRKTSRKIRPLLI